MEFRIVRNNFGTDQYWYFVQKYLDGEWIMAHHIPFESVEAARECKKRKENSTWEVVE